MADVEVGEIGGGKETGDRRPETEDRRPKTEEQIIDQWMYYSKYSLSELNIK